jgi:hypothetical protein
MVNNKLQKPETNDEKKMAVEINEVEQLESVPGLKTALTSIQLAAKEAKKKRDLERKKQRYWTDPSYRLRVSKSNSKYYHKNCDKAKVRALKRKAIIDQKRKEYCNQNKFSTRLKQNNSVKSESEAEHLKNRKQERAQKRIELALKNLQRIEEKEMKRAKLRETKYLKNLEKQCKKAIEKKQFEEFVSRKAEYLQPDDDCSLIHNGCQTCSSRPLFPFNQVDDFHEEFSYKFEKNCCNQNECQETFLLSQIAKFEQHNFILLNSL